MNPSNKLGIEEQASSASSRHLLGPLNRTSWRLGNYGLWRPASPFSAQRASWVSFISRRAGSESFKPILKNTVMQEQFGFIGCIINYVQCVYSSECCIFRGREVLKFIPLYNDKYIEGKDPDM